MIGYMIVRGKGSTNNGWQLVLADLSLILFLVTLTALVNTSDEANAWHARTSVVAPLHVAPSYVAPSQALFRPTARGPNLAQWLAEQPADPRATLTIIAQYSSTDKDLVWADAHRMASSIAPSDVPVRVVITKGEQSDLYASLAYDEPELSN
ncbi:MAG: hypothetical protein ABJK59_10395 [Erythrobacter sp.]|uniref:hypothetical protein n=1 Tax=Erythrobacter sp. TaxID=1042 RepID=UPI00329854C5